MDRGKKIMWNCSNDCDGWQECYNLMTGKPESPLREFFETAGESSFGKCPFCGAEVWTEEIVE